MYKKAPIATIKKNLFSVRLQLEKKDLNLASMGQAKKKQTLIKGTSDFFLN